MTHCFKFDCAATLEKCVHGLWKMPVAGKSCRSVAVEFQVFVMASQKLVFAKLWQNIYIGRVQRRIKWYWVCYSFDCGTATKY